MVATFLDVLNSERSVLVDGRRNELLALAARLAPRGPLLRVVGPRFEDKVTASPAR